MTPGPGAPSVDRLLGRMIAVCGILATAAAWQRILGQAPDLAAPWQAGAFACVLALLLLAALGRVLPLAVLRAAWVLVIAIVIALQATVFVAYSGPDPDALRPWAWVLELPAMCLLPLLMRPAAAFLVSTALPMSMVLPSWAVHGHVPDTVLAMTPIHLGNIAVLVVVVALRRRLLALQQVQLIHREIDVRRIRAEARLRRQHEVARLVHDDVLSALLVAIRLPGPSRPEVREAAGRGLAALRAAVQAPPPAAARHEELDAVAVRRMVVDAVGGDAASRSLSIDLRSGTIPGDVAAQSARAVAEAVRNSAAHASEEPVVVTGELGGDGLRLVVSDRGPGFDLGATSPERMGVGLSILGRMRGLPGGAAEVSSGPAGTRVEVGWTRTEMEAVDTGLSSRVARAALVAVWLTGVAHGLLTGSFPAADPTVGVLVYGVALLGVLLATSGPAGPLRRAVAIAAVVCGFAMAIAVIGYADATGAPAAELWLLTFGAYLVGVVIARGNPAIGGAGAAAMIVWLGIWAWGTQRAFEGYAAMVTPVLVSALAGCTWLIATLAVARKEEGILAAGRRAVAVTSAAVSERWASRRELRDIHRAAEPVLERIAGGADVDEPSLRELEIVEGGIRDRIRAAGLYRPVLATAVAEARGRGVQVLLLGDEGAQGRISERLALAIAAVVAEPEARSVTVRAFAGQVSVVLEGADGARDRIVLGADGGRVQNGQTSGT